MTEGASVHQGWLDRSRARALPSIHREGALEAARCSLGVSPEQIRRFRNELYKRGRASDEACRSWPAEARAALEASWEISSLREISRIDSQRDGASKLLLSTRSGHVLEAVILRIKSGRTSLCVSSGVGCAAKCSFCATGGMGVARPLSASEILEQVVRANQLLLKEARRVRNVVFMGMGEPLHNREAVEEAIARFLDPKWFGLSANHVLVSTVGVLDELERFADRFPDVQLALSLHAARDEVRERLIPLAKQYPVRALRKALIALQTRRRKPVMIEYLMIDGVNDGADDLCALIEFSRELDVHVNLIPLNPTAVAPTLTASPPERVSEAARLLRAAGLKVTVRYSLGRDVEAACGQLASAHVRRAQSPAPKRRPKRM